MVGHWAVRAVQHCMIAGRWAVCATVHYIGPLAADHRGMVRSDAGAPAVTHSHPQEDRSFQSPHDLVCLYCCLASWIHHNDYGGYSIVALALLCRIEGLEGRLQTRQAEQGVCTVRHRLRHI
jgi:hypothetical protein